MRNINEQFKLFAVILSKTFSLPRAILVRIQINLSKDEP